MTNLANISGADMQVNIFDAKTDLSKLIKLLETKEETSITIARHGKPVAVLLPFAQEPKTNRIGFAKGKIPFSDSFDIDDLDADNALIADMFYGEDK